MGPRRALAVVFAVAAAACTRPSIPSPPIATLPGPPIEDMDDVTVSRDVHAALASDDALADAVVGVDVRGGIVSLTGTVTTPEAKRRAVLLSQVVRGVRSVIDRLAVAGNERDWTAEVVKRPEEPPNLGDEPYARDPSRRNVAFVRPDRVLVDAVRDAFANDPRLLGAALQVRAQNGSVTITGAVERPAARDAAIDDARNTVGVTRTEDLIRVERPGPRLQRPERPEER